MAIPEPPAHAGSLPEMVAAGEAALRRGDAAGAFWLLPQAAARLGAQDGPGGAAPAADSGLRVRLTRALAAAARIVGEPARVLTWIEGVLPATTDDTERAALLVAQLSMWSRLDTTRALALEAEARAAAEAVGDELGIATVLALASFVAYRRGEVRRCREIADRAAALVLTTRAAQYQATRAQMFAATAAGDLETVLTLSIKGRALARDLGQPVDVGNESNNLAETYLELGYPHEARACAEVAERLSRDAGMLYNELAGRVNGASAAAEAGDLDGAIAILDGLGWHEQYPIVMIDAAAAHAYWLLERGAAGDATVARARATAGIELARRTGTAHRLTALHASLARAHAREANHAAAREQLEHARRGADKVEPTAHSLLALAAAEVLSADDAPRQVILMAARTRILRAAARREDPHAFCAHVRHNRRLLELTGGVPEDLPRAS
jgi:tetratricopeptide (TPR) repeat protein